MRGRAEARPSGAGFTIIELLIVMAIIIVLAGLVLATAGYVQKKGARSRAEAEIAAMSAALESYKADNGIYPTDANKTEKFDPASTNDTDYKTASLFLYGEITGDKNGDGAADSSASKSYMAFKPAMLQRMNMSQDLGGSNPVTAIRDPFGNSYGYSTLKASNPVAAGYNPTFDLWSVGDGARGTDQSKWIKNW